MDFLNQTMHSKMIGELIYNLNIRKEQVIKQRMKELGIKIDEETEKKRRFKTLLCVKQDNEETYYFNNGSSEGLRIVTFVEDPREVIPKNYSVHISIELSYY